MDKVYDVTKKRVSHNNFRTIGTIIIVGLLVIISIFGTYQALIANARDMGLELVRSYTADEERNIAVYKTFIQMGMYYLNEEKNAGQDEDNVEQNVRNFLRKGVEEIGDESLLSYAVVDGKMISTDVNDTEISEDYEKSEWYQKMKKAKGEVVFSDVQGDGLEKSVFVGSVDPSSGDAIFFDIKRENLNALHRDLNLPQQGAYYLCDSSGKLLYYQAPFSVDESSIEEYAAKLCDKIQDGSIAETGDSVVDISGKKRGLYHNSISNGWICIMTIPHAVLLSGFYKVLAICSVVFLIFFVIMLFISVRDARLGNHVIHANASIHALCNTYYAIYRINLKKATYVMMKGSGEMQKLIPKSGTYEEMLQGFSQVVADEETVRELCTSFSLEHLKKLKNANIGDFGGDFLRELEGEQKWVNISFILDDALGEDEAMLAFRQIDAEKRQQLTHTKLLETALEAADASEKAQKTFFSNMSHEMRTL